MKKLEKIALVDTIARELQKRMTFSEIYGYFEAYGIPTDHQPSYNSKYVYAKEVLAKVEDDIILEITSELKIEHSALKEKPLINEEDPNFWKPGHFRLFISHLASFKSTIGTLKKELEKYGISSFVAHEDIEPTKIWQEEIEKGLFSMEALCAVLMPDFNLSKWTDQEIGVAIGRGVLIIPIRRGMDPYGFIGKYQGFQASGKNIGEVVKGIFTIISSNEKTRNTLINKLVELFLLSKNEEDGLQRFNAIKLINPFPNDKIEILKSRIIENDNLKSNEILSALNDIIIPLGHKKITLSDFNKLEIPAYDNLPF